jgi:hypothetical protein
MEQISTRHKKIIAGRYLIVVCFATLVNVLTHIIEKLAPRYNYILYISALLQICNGQ